jgi:hypothetical protein
LQPATCKLGIFSAFTIRYYPSSKRKTSSRHISANQHSPYHQLPPREQAKVDRIVLRNPGYVSGLSFLEKTPPKRWSEERKHNHRRNLMEKRMAKLYSIPELLEEAVQNQLASKPEYYGLVPLALPLNLSEHQAEGAEPLPSRRSSEAFSPT